MTSSESLAAARGAAFLDERVPGWEVQIDLGRLEFPSPTCCVVGQIYGDLQVGYKQLGVGLGGDVQFDVSEHGFNLPALLRDPDQQWTDLTAAWRALIEQRRKERGE